MIDYRQYGYTHIISYKKLLEWAAIFVEESFPTTADAVQIHLDRLNAKASKNGVQLIKNIKAISL